MKINSLIRKGSDVEVIFYDDSKLVLDYKAVVDFGLRKNDELTEEKIEEIKNRSEINKIISHALRFLGRRLHSTYELKLKLIKKGYNKYLIDFSLAELKEKGLINDKEFSKIFLDEKSIKRKNGILKIKLELQKKGIERKIIDETIEDFNKNINTDNAFKLARKKYELTVNKEKDSRKLKQKIYSYLASKGYGSETIKASIQKLNIPLNEFE
jgi:regulatory protein